MYVAEVVYEKCVTPYEWRRSREVEVIEYDEEAVRRLMEIEAARGAEAAIRWLMRAIAEGRVREMIVVRKDVRYVYSGSCSKSIVRYASTRPFAVVKRSYGYRDGRFDHLEVIVAKEEEIEGGNEFGRVGV